MSNTQYNYSVSLIRKAKDLWSIDPEDASAQAFRRELSSKRLGDCYLATKTQGELSFYIYLSGDLCQSDICGWIVTLNGWCVHDLNAYLHLSQEVWRQLEQSPSQNKSSDIRQLLHELMESTGLILSSSPAPIDRNVEHHYQSLNFTPKKKPRVVPKTTEKDSNDGHIWATLVLVFIFVGPACFLIAQVFSRSSSTRRESTESVTAVDRAESYRDQTSYTSYPVGADSAMIEGSNETPAENETPEEVSNADEAERLFRRYLWALDRGDYREALDCFDFPMPKFLSRRNLSPKDLYTEMSVYNQANPIQDTSILGVEHLEGGVARITFVWDRLMEGRYYERFLVVSTVKARETYEGWRLYSVSERSQKVES